MDPDTVDSAPPDTPDFYSPGIMQIMGAGGPPQLPQQPPPPVSMIPQGTDPNMVEAHAAAVHHERMANAANVVSNLLGGSKTVHLTRHPDGTVEMTHDPATGSEKWGRIAAAAISGAAKGWANGQGPGGAGRAAGAGFDAGEQVQKAPEEAARAQVEQSQKDVLFKANHAALDQQYVRNAELMREQGIKFTQEQFDKINEGEKAMSNAPGSEVIGDFDGVKDLPSFSAKYPKAMDGHIKEPGSYLQFFAQPDGKTRVILMNRAMGEQIMENPPPISTAYFDGPSQSVKYRDVAPSKGITVNGWATANKGQQTANSNLELSVAEKLRAKPENPDTYQKALAAASAATDPAEKARLTALGQDLYEKDLKRAAAGRAVTQVNPYTPPAGTNPATIQTSTKSGQPVWGRQYGAGDPNSAFENQSRQLALGEKTENDIPKRFGKGQPTIADYSNRARQITQDMFGKDFEYNPKQIEKEYKDYSSGKWTAAYNAMDRLAGRADGTQTGDPPLLTQLEQAARKAGLSDNAPINDVVQATKRFFGNDAAKALQFDLAETQKSLGQVTGNPTLGSSDTNVKLRQMQDAYGGDMTVKNLKKTNIEARKAINAERQAGFTNNRFLRRAYGGEALTAAPSGPTGGGPAAGPDAEPQVTVQLPGHPPGQIPKSQLEKFKTDNPTAQVTP